MGLAQQHPAKDNNAQQIVDALLPRLRADLGTAALAAALQQGAALDLDMVVAELLAEPIPSETPTDDVAALEVAHVRLDVGDVKQARATLRASLTANRQTAQPEQQAEALVVAARLKLAAGDATGSAHLAGLVEAVSENAAAMATSRLAPLITALKAQMSDADLQAAIAEGKTLDPSTASAQMIAEWDDAAAP
ncbi:MAG: hypothetical protein GYB67_18345 [Chloroflexi bacterium]|nr:hypothetical protein [Chloroflexota bacterium]